MGEYAKEIENIIISGFQKNVNISEVLSDLYLFAEKIW